MTPTTDQQVSPLSQLMFSCDGCGHTQHVNGGAPGKRAKCPKCGHTGRITSQPRETPLAGPATYDSPITAPAKAHPTESHPTLPAHPAVTHPTERHAEATTRCPYCREFILVAARKCKHCHEFLDETLRQLRDQSERRHKAEDAPGVQVSKRQMVMIGGGVAVAIAIIAIVWLKAGSSPSNPGGGPAIVPAAMAKTPAAAPGQAAAPAESSSSMQPLLTGLKKALEGTEIKDDAGSLMQFPTGFAGAWECTSSKASLGTIELPYRFTPHQAGIAPNRGRLVLELAEAKGVWALKSVSKKATFLIVGGKEQDIPEEDQQIVKLPDRDFVLKHLVEVVSAAQSH